MGRFGSCSPARARRTASDTAARASSCPTTRPRSLSSMARSLSFSPSSILSTGTPVQRETTAAICSASTTSGVSVSRGWPSASLSCRSTAGIWP